MGKNPESATQIQTFIFLLYFTLLYFILLYLYLYPFHANLVLAFLVF